jgi:type II secretory pathway pseudopilin PulG
MKRSVFINSISAACGERRVSLHFQRGGTLIESLIGMLILGIIGGGIMHSTARMTVAQRDMTVHSVAINQMRNILMSGATPAGGNVCDTAPAINLPGEAEAQQLAVKGCGLAPMKITGITIDGTAVEQTIDSARPLVLELGTGDKLVRIGGNVANAGGI